MKLEGIFGRIFISIIFAAFTFLLLDFVSLFIIKDRRPSVEKTFPVAICRRPKPYVMFGWSDDSEYPGRKHLLKKAPNEFRICIVGGSTVARGDPTISDLLEEEFKTRGYNNVIVYNFGVVSSVSGQDLVRIIFEVSEFKPDLIVMYNGGNDIISPYSTDPRPGYPFNFIVYENNPIVDKGVSRYPVFALFAYGSNMLRYILKPYFTEKFTSLQKVRQEVGWGTDVWKDEIARIYVSNLVKAYKVSHSFNTEFMVFFHPLVFYKEPLTPEEQLINPEQRQYSLDVRDKILAEISKAKKDFPELNFIDISDIYDGVDERVFSDLVHTYQEFRIIPARKMYKHIVDCLRRAGVEEFY